MWTQLILFFLLALSVWSQTMLTCPAGSHSVPTRPPLVAAGNYESVRLSADGTRRDIFIYWQTVREIEMCDWSFEYRAYYITRTKENHYVMHPSNGTNKNRAWFVGLRTDMAYHFQVFSANKGGLSADHASLYVSSESNGLEEPSSFKSVRHMTDYSYTYDLSWAISGSKKFSEGNQLDYYTLYWCVSDSEHIHQCVDQLNWLHVPGSERSYKLTVPNDRSGNKYVFAISANRLRNSFNSNKTVSSGMVWESCKPLDNEGVKNSYTVINSWATIIESTYIGLRWKFDCVEEFDIVDEYKIVYCPSYYGNQCTGLQLSKNFENKYMRHERVAFNFIVDLRPSTPYLIQIFISSNFSRLSSVPLMITTLPKL